MIRLRNKLTKEKKKFHTQAQASVFLRCSPSMVSQLNLGKIPDIRNWKINKYPVSRPWIRK